MHRVRYQVSILFLLDQSFVSLTTTPVRLVVVIVHLFRDLFHFLRLGLFCNLLRLFDLIGFLFYPLGRRLPHDVTRWSRLLNFRRLFRQKILNSHIGARRIVVICKGNFVRVKWIASAHHARKRESVLHESISTICAMLGKLLFEVEQNYQFCLWRN